MGEGAAAAAARQCRKNAVAASRVLSSGLLRRQPSLRVDAPSFYTVTVGRKPSKAKYFLKDVGEVTELLNQLAQQTVANSFSRYTSIPNIAGAVGAAVDSSSDEDYGPTLEPV